MVSIPGVIHLNWSYLECLNAWKKSIRKNRNCLKNEMIKFCLDNTSIENKAIFSNKSDFFLFVFVVLRIASNRFINTFHDIYNNFPV